MSPSGTERRRIILDAIQQKSLLLLARESISALLYGRALPDPGVLPEIVVPYGGVFVTLRNRMRLRGCMGRFEPEDPLALTVQRMALSVLEDPRFTRMPVTIDELPALRIEISVLSALERTLEPERLIPGTHGVFIRQGPHSGCFLPQVAVEQRWDALELLSRCCETKAMLPVDAWRDPKTHVYLFTALVFSDPSDP